MSFQFFIAPLTASSLYFEKIIKGEKKMKKSLQSHLIKLGFS